MAQIVLFCSNKNLIHYQNLKYMCMNFIALAYAVTCICVVIYVITLAARFVSAHERVAGALESIARKQKDEAKP